MSACKSMRTHRSCAIMLGTCLVANCLAMVVPSLSSTVVLSNDQVLIGLALFSHTARWLLKR